MSSEASNNFERSKTALQIEIEVNNNLSEVIRKVNELHKYLIDISPSLVPYERERYGIDITNLVQQIADKERLHEQVKPKTFQFKGKKRTEEETDNPIKKIILDKEEILPNIITTDAHIILSEANCSFVDLSHCRVTSGSHAAHPSKTGSLTFHRIADTVINLQKLPFHTGSIFISECQDSVIVFNLPVDSHIQIRLHNLENCKLLIASQQKQTVILEGCENCWFHSSTERFIVIQDFSNLNLENGIASPSKSYQFRDFEVLGLDTNAITERYINS